MTVELPATIVTPDNRPVDFGVGGAWGYESGAPLISYPTDDHSAEAAAYRSIHEYEESVRHTTETTFPSRRETLSKNVNDQVSQIISEKTDAFSSTTEGLPEVKTALEMLDYTNYPTSR